MSVEASIEAGRSRSGSKRRSKPVGLEASVEAGRKRSKPVGLEASVEAGRKRSKPVEAGENFGVL